MNLGFLADFVEKICFYTCGILLQCIFWALVFSPLSLSLSFFFFYIKMTYSIVFLCFRNWTLQFVCVFLNNNSETVLCVSQRKYIVKKMRDKLLTARKMGGGGGGKCGKRKGFNKSSGVGSELDIYTWIHGFKYG